MSLEAVTEEPHHNYSSFRIQGKIFVTIPPNEDFIHVFVAEEDREPVLALYPEFIEKLLWGGKVMGLRITMESAKAAVVRSLVDKAYRTRVRKDADQKAAKPKSRAVKL